MSVLTTFQTDLSLAQNTLAQPALSSSLAANSLSNLILGTPNIPNQRAPLGVTNRSNEIMSWRLPSGTVVDMYINPQNLTINDSKLITPIRTKGGYTIQYWGENLTEIAISGHTGSSGIRGIEVLRSIYRSENTAFDLVVATQQNELINILSQQSNIQNPNASQVVSQYNQNLQQRNYLLRPALGALATSVIMFFQGVQYKGYFNSFSVTENTDQLGLFNYTISFSATSRSGRRNNFMAWHKEPSDTTTTGQLFNSAGNAIRGSLGLAAQPPQQYFPETAPYTFGAFQEVNALGLASPAQSTAKVNAQGVALGIGAINSGQFG